jgi:hypothetical protein
LPRNPTNARTFERSNGGASLSIEACRWWNGREVEIEHSVRAFLRRLGVD